MEVAGGVEGVKSGGVEVEVPDQSFLTRVVVGVESEEEEGEVCGGEGVLVEARAAAEAAKENLDANQPDSHAAFLKRDREAQRTLLSFINPDSGEGVCVCACVRVCVCARVCVVKCVCMCMCTCEVGMILIPPSFPPLPLVKSIVSFVSRFSSALPPSPLSSLPPGPQAG